MVAKPGPTGVSPRRGNVSRERALIQSCFRESPYLALRNVVCDMNQGVAQLEGVLPSYYLKQLAQEIVMQHECVREVNNRIEVHKH